MTNLAHKPIVAFVLFLGIAFLLPGLGLAADWPQWGGSPGRNNVSDATRLPVEWDIGRFDRTTGQWLDESAENVRWVARLGSTSYGTPVVAGDMVYCATNNATGYVRRYPAEIDLGCLLCFSRADGRFGWQLSREKLTAGREVDWPEQGICAAPLVEGDRLWIVTNRAEVVCLDANGFFDGQNDGPFTDEPNADRSEADIVWLHDMMGQLGVVPHNMASCSVTATGDLLLVCTSNGRDDGTDDGADEMPAPDAPSFIALNKKTGELVWADNTPGANTLHGHWSSPAFAVLGGVPQALFPGGDGWLYAFRAEATDTKKPELLWKFDCNPKASVWKPGGRGDRNNLIATPVVCDGRVYIGVGQDPEHGPGEGRLWCIDPTRRGDVSPELVVDRAGNPVGPRRETAVDTEAGERVKPNPNSAALWCYTADDANGDGKRDFEETMHRTLGMAAVKDNLLVVADIGGMVHCLDATTGKVHWTHDMLADVWGGPLLADGKIHLGSEDGVVLVLALSAEKNILAENDVGSPVYSTPVAVDGVLYVATSRHLIALEVEQ